MAEGLARHFFTDTNVQVQSAGSSPSRVNPFAIRVMQELNIDIRSHSSKSVAAFENKKIDLVITLCKEEVCPVFLSKTTRWHWPLEDPDRKSEKLSLEQRLYYFRIARDEIQARLKNAFVSS